MAKKNKRSTKRKRLMINPVFWIIVVDILAYGMLYFYQENYDKYILLAGLLSILLTAGSYFIILKFKLGDELLFPVIAMLFNLGLIMIFRLDTSDGFSQIRWLVLGIIVFFVALILYRKFNFWPQLFWLYFGVSILLFLITLVFGSNVNGSTNWLFIGGISIQTSEVNKLLYIFMLSSFYVNPEVLNLRKVVPKAWQQNKPVAFLVSLPPKFYLMMLTYVYVGFLLLQRELGTILLIMMIYLAFLYVIDNNKKFFVFNTALVVVGGLIAIATFSHVQVRMQAWLNPWEDLANSGYQITQSLFAIGSGGFFGTGLGLGKPYYIPQAQTDFIFSAICEEMGIFGGISIVLLFFILAYRGLKITLRQNNAFRKNIALGLTVMMGFQAFIIIGGVIKLIPMTGITLPFVSYGGSSMIICFATMGIIQASSLFYGDSAEIKKSGQQAKAAVNHPKEDAHA